MQKISGGLAGHLRCVEGVRRRKDHGENDQNGIPEPRERTQTIVVPSNGCRITGYIHDKS